MKYGILLFFSILPFVYGCSTQIPVSKIQIVELQSENYPSAGNSLKFENDTIRIDYYFWSERGSVGLLVQNKLQQPLYIDWKKCSFITGNVKHDYWDGSFTMTSQGVASWNSYPQSYQSIFGGYGGSSGESNFTSESRIERPERVTFIPPGTAISVSSQSLVDDSLSRGIPMTSGWDFDTTLILSTNPDSTVYQDHETYDSVKHRLSSTYTRVKGSDPVQIPVNAAEFSAAASPLAFRSFLTYSTDEKFAAESYIDNHFYANLILQLSPEAYNAKRANGVPLNRQGNIWADQNRFYITVVQPHPR